MFDKIFQLLKKKELQLFEAPEPEAPEPEAKFGGETMILGEATESLPHLTGTRIKTNAGEEGTIAIVLINDKTRVVQIWVDMDDRRPLCLCPQNIGFTGEISLQNGLLSRGDE